MAKREFEVEYDGEEQENVLAHSEEDAAIAFAHAYFYAGDCECPDGDDVLVREVGDIPWTHFRVTMEMVPSFTVRPVSR